MKQVMVIMNDCNTVAAVYSDGHIPAAAHAHDDKLCVLYYTLMVTMLHAYTLSEYTAADL